MRTAYILNGKTKKKSKHYDNIYIRFSREEYKAWCLQNREKIEALKRPSLDRIDKTKDYEFGNIQIVELSQNIRKDKTVFSETHGRCYACKNTLPIESFVNDRRRGNGKKSICKPCDTRRKLKQREKQNEY